MDFVNRISELRSLDSEPVPFAVIFGRRRVGKTSLIEQWGKDKPLYYSQAIEASEFQQIQQIMGDLRDILPEGLGASNWLEFFPILSLIQKECIIVFDEFPYLAKAERSLPSQLQRWIDHKQPGNVRLVGRC